MKKTVLYIILCLCVFFLEGCSSAPHPLLRALAPENAWETVTGSSSLDAKTSAHLRVPFIPDSHLLVSTRGDLVLVKLRPPFNTEEMGQLYQEELAKRRVTNVVLEKNGATMEEAR